MRLSRFLQVLNETPELWNDKHIVWSQNGVRIAVNDPDDATYVTVWTDDNKRIGAFSTRGTRTVNGKRYLMISTIDLNKKFRGQGIGHQMYRALLVHMAPNLAGLISYLPDAVNAKQVPRIHHRLGAQIVPDEADFHIIARPLAETQGKLLDAPTPSPERIAQQHRVPLDYVLAQLEQGIGIEREHTDHDDVAREIALDHLHERPDYYERLKKVEGDEPVNESVLDRASYWITNEGKIIQAETPEIVWHTDEAGKHFPNTRDPLGMALTAGWIRINAAGHYFDIQMDFGAASPLAINEAIRLIREVQIDINYNVEENEYSTKAFKSQNSVIRFLNQIKRNHRTTGVNESSDPFRTWFGNSKVVDAQGKPLVVYHSTNKRFQSFSSKATPGGITWFTSDKSALDRREKGASGAGRILQLYARIENPAGWDEYDKYGLGQLVSMGYDGVILPDPDGSFDGFVFDPKQLKAVTNKGGWSRDSAKLNEGEDRIIHDASPQQLKGLANRAQDGIIRFVLYRDGSISAGDAFKYTHQEIAPAMGAWAARGYIRLMPGGEYLYTATPVYSALPVNPAEYPALGVLERGGIHNGHGSDLTEEELSVTEHNYTQTLEVTKNPTAEQLLGITKRAKKFATRGLLGPGDVLYVWDAYDGNHDMIGKAMRREWGVNYNKAEYVHMEFSLIDPRAGISTDIAQSGMKQFGPLWCTPNRKFAQSYWGVVLAKKPKPSPEEHDRMIRIALGQEERQP